MHRFAISSEPGGLTDRPVPGAPGVQPVPGTSESLAPQGAPSASLFSKGLDALRSAGEIYKAMAGTDAYDRYVRHHALHHPGHEPMSEAEFWRASWDNDAKNPKTRCC